MRWDSLGEFLALAVSLEHLAAVTKHEPAQILADTLNEATGQILNNNRSPSRKVNELDNRGSHFYLAQYWAQALASQDRDPNLRAEFEPIASRLTELEGQILDELNAAQGSPVDIGGYYHPDASKVAAAMRPSASFNEVLGG